jgi:hypothetical protein
MALPPFEMKRLHLAPARGGRGRAKRDKNRDKAAMGRGR